MGDPSQLQQVILNLMVNARDAMPNGGEVVFEVHNPGVMPETVQRQIFQRSFSTKDEVGRGIGTYSVRLLAEQYLGGRVSFVSEPEAGTIFTVRVPRGMSEG